MRNKLTFTAAAMALGFAFVQAWPGDWGGLGNAYAQAQSITVKRPLKAGTLNNPVAKEEVISSDQLRIAGNNGLIVIRPGDSGKIRYSVSYKRPFHGWNFGLFLKSSKGRDMGNTVHFDPKNGLQIHAANRWEFKALVWAPQNIQITVISGNGNIDIAQHNGIINAYSESGDVRIDASSGKLNVTSQSGNVSVTNSAGPIMVKAESGNVRIIGGLKGLDVRAESGDISIIGSGPNCRAKTDSGNIIFSPTALKPAQCIEAHTESGDIKVSRQWKICDQSTVSLQAESGDIVIK